MRNGDIVLHAITGARGVVIDVVAHSPARVQWPNGRIYKHQREELRETGEREPGADLLAEFFRKGFDS